MPPVRMRGDGRKAKDPKKVLLRLLSYMKQYIPILIVVLLCILGSAIAQTTGSKSLGALVDDYILPMVETGSTDFSPLLSFLGHGHGVRLFAAVFDGWRQSGHPEDHPG